MIQAALQYEQLSLVFAEDLPTRAIERKPRAKKPAFTMPGEQLAIVFEFSFAAPVIAPEPMVEVPAEVEAPKPRVTIYDYLSERGMLRKLTDIALHKAGVPWHLRDEAAQEIRMAWATYEAKSELAPSRVYQYATTAGEHAALKLRRKIGAVVSIPGQAFRDSESAFMKSIGAAVNPLDVDDYADSRELSVDFEDATYDEEADERIEGVSVDELGDRLGGVQLTRMQRQVVALMLAGLSADEIADELGRKPENVEKMMSDLAYQISKAKGLALAA